MHVPISNTRIRCYTLYVCVCELLNQVTAQSWSHNANAIIRGFVAKQTTLLHVNHVSQEQVRTVS